MREDNENIHHNRMNHQHGPYQRNRGSYHHRYDDDIEHSRSHWQVSRWDRWRQVVRSNRYSGKRLNREHGPYQCDRGSYHHRYDGDIEHSRSHWQVSRWDHWRHLVRSNRYGGLGTIV